MAKRSQANSESRENQMCDIGINRKLESKVALTVSIFDHNVNNVNSFKYQRLGLLNRIKPFSARLLFNNSLVIPLFDYADLVWGE